MNATTIKHFFSTNLLITAFVMSAYSSAGVNDYQTNHKNQLFAVQSENIYMLIDENPQQQSKKQSIDCITQPPTKSNRKQVSWFDWFTNSHNSSFHFLNLLELIGK